MLLALLAPNGRPVQMTRDLRSFWERTYPEVRKELRGRYPRHPWPDDPVDGAADGPNDAARGQIGQSVVGSRESGVSVGSRQSSV